MSEPIIVINPNSTVAVTEDIDRFHFNTTVSALMALVNNLGGYLSESPRGETFDDAFRILLLMLSPMAPHIAHELWELRGYEGMPVSARWPEWDEGLVTQATVTMVIQVNGKVRDRIEVPADISSEEAENLALESEKIQAWVDDSNVKKVIALPPNIVNFVVE